MTVPEEDAANETSERQPRSLQAPRVVTSETLLRGQSQVAIVHEHTVYFLRKTRFGKLILTK